MSISFGECLLLNLFVAFFLATFAFSQACEYNIIWDRDFCNETEPNRLQTSILPPNNVDSLCEFEMGSVVSLEHLNGQLTENLYQVQTKGEFADCNAI